MLGIVPAPDLSEAPMEEKILARVRGLLAKAESTEFPEEAEALTAKAADLIAKYGIDQALLAAAGKTRDEIAALRVDMQDPYSKEKATLLSAIARPLRCKVISSSYRGQRGVSFATVIGHQSDLERVELLYTSLLLQAARQVQHHRPLGYGSVAAYRRTWYHGFAIAVQGRLQAAEQRAASATQTCSEGPSTALVLRDRSAAVEEACAELFPKAKKPQKRTLSGDGYSDGKAAGQRADLGNGRVGGRKAAIGHD